MNDRDRFLFGIKTIAELDAAIPTIKRLYSHFTEAYAAIVNFPAGWNRQTAPMISVSGVYESEEIANQAKQESLDIMLGSRAEIARKASRGDRAAGQTLKRIDELPPIQVFTKRLW
jgi:hypothetical protein